MSGTGRVIESGQVSYPPEDHRPVCQVLTDATGRESAVYIAVDGPRPLDGTVISWGPHHVTWLDALGRRAVAKKVGGAFRWQSDRTGTDGAIGVG